MKLRPLQDRILVQRVEEEEKTKGGIIIPDTAKEKPAEGKVVSVGKGKVDENGKRYCNEGFGDPIFVGFPGAQLKRHNITVVFDSSIFEDLQYSPPAHTAFWVNDEASENGLKDNMAAARAAGAAGS